MGIFGEPGTYGETENRRIFGHMRQTIERLSNNIELLTLELHMANRIKRIELADRNKNLPIDPEFNILDELIDSKIKRIETAIKGADAKEKGGNDDIKRISNKLKMDIDTFYEKYDEITRICKERISKR